MERLRRLPEATMQEFHDAGILRVIQPAAFGGFEADFICQVDLTYEIARSCGAECSAAATVSRDALSLTLRLYAQIFLPILEYSPLKRPVRCGCEQ